jgi:TolB-like protein
VNLRNFVGELKRRNVYKVAIAYAIVAWLLMQVASQIFPFFEIPSWMVRAVIVLLLLGFPIALVLAWAFELTPEGIKRAEFASELLEKSIAVLPFENLGDNPENAYFADGIQEEILMRLAKVADLKVVSRTSTVRYKRSPGSLREIATQLGLANASTQRCASLAALINLTFTCTRSAARCTLPSRTPKRQSNSMIRWPKRTLLLFSCSLVISISFKR